MANYEVDEDVGQVEIGVRLSVVGQAADDGTLNVPIMARISTNDGTAIAGADGKNHRG